MPGSITRKLSRPLSGKITRLNTRGELYSGGGGDYHDGISLDFRRNRFYTKPVGRPARETDFLSLFSFTGDNKSKYRGSSGLLIPSVTNVPRIEFDFGGEMLGLLIEASRINLSLQSEDASSATWTKSAATVGANVGTSPDGTANADSIIEDNTNAEHFIQQAAIVGSVANVVHTASAWVKANGRTTGRIRLAAATGSTIADFNLTAGTITGLGASGNGTQTGATIVRWLDGWFRITVTGAPDTTSGATFAFRLQPTNGAGVVSYIGDTVSGILVFGTQLEAGAFASSYLPTVAATVTRGPETCQRVLSTEFNALAGSALVQFRSSGGQDAAFGQGIFGFDDGTLNESIRLIRVAASDTLRMNFIDGGAVSAQFNDVVTNLSNNKYALAWMLNDFAASFNGAAVATDVAGTLPTTPSLFLGNVVAGSQANGHTKKFDYWPTRLPNTQLMQMAA